MANSNVTVDTHSREGKDTGEHVVVINGHHNLAQHVSKRPCTHQVIDALERQSACCQGICQSKVENVDVGRSFHLGVSAMDKNLSRSLHQLCLLNNMYSGKIILIRVSNGEVKEL